MTEAERMRPVGGACARLCSPQRRPRPRGHPSLRPSPNGGERGSLLEERGAGGWGSDFGRVKAEAAPGGEASFPGQI